MTRARRPSVCTVHGCPELAPGGGRCPTHRAEADRVRGTSRERGYTTWWDHNRKAFLKANPLCVDCGAQAEVPDHDPISRRDLVSMGVEDPDAWDRLKPRCTPCHNRRTALYDGGFGRPARVVDEVTSTPPVGGGSA